LSLGGGKRPQHETPAMATHVESGPPGSARPTGAVTFLFSDIEGSTVRWERDSEAMAPALARHDALMRVALEARGAYVFKTIGDAFCAAFARAADAIAAALDAQRALAAADFSDVEGLRVRMALHAGSAHERDGDYFGPAVNRVARLLAVGHGGQVLLSGACAELFQAEPPPECSLRDLGEHRLKDLAQSERIYQLLTPDLIADFPPLRSLEHLSNNLPAQVTSFIGREAEIAEITALIEQHRLVTLVGSGGVGKTRLSLQVAADLIDDFRDGVWFVELAPLGRGEYIPSTVALALGITLPSEGDPVENIARALKGKELLLVFDNCEHLIEPAAHATSVILRAAPKVTVLASSRQTLGVAGEAAYHVPSLDLPTGVALFVERARAANATFALTDENAPIIAEICRRLDGIALAIELAAARLKMLGPKQLRDRLDERFRVLTGGGRDVLPRQQTLRAMIDWSHDLLDERERALFRRLGIFVDGFALEGAVGVGSGDESLDELDVFDVLASLVDKSLVLAEPQGEAMRYRLLESTRAYALEKLGDAGERDLIADRHLRYLRERFAELRPEIERTDRRADLRALLRTEVEDVRSALDGALARSQLIDGAELLTSVYTVWLGIGLEAEGITRCEAHLAALPADQLQLRARVSTILAYFLTYFGDRVFALELATQAVELARTSGDASSLAMALRQYSVTALHLRRLDDVEQALAQAEAIPGISTNIRRGLLESRAHLSLLRGDLETAARAWEQLRQEYRSLGETRAEQVVVFDLAEVEHARGATLRAITLVREALPVVRAGSDTALLATALYNLAGYCVAMDDLTGAFAAARESIGIRGAREPDHNYVALAIYELALALALRGERARAATLRGYAEAALRRRGFELQFVQKRTHDRLTSLLRDELAPDELARLTAEGVALTPDAAIALALEEY
jgi:predicted ATPase/class 3 adenylate cyclase